MIMNWLFRILLIPVLAVFLGSCSSMNKELIRSVKTVAVVSIVFDKKVDVSAVSSDAGLLGKISSLAQGDKFKLDAEAGAFKTILFREYSDYFPFKVLPESSVVNAKEYQQAFRATQDRKSYLVGPAKYALLDLSQSGDVPKALQAAPNAEGVMLIRVYFALQKTGLSAMGFGTARVHAYASMIVFNKSGKDIMMINQWAASDKTLSFALGGVFNGDEVIPLVKEASRNVMIAIKDWLQKNPL
jgi:hypothetical protein